MAEKKHNQMQAMASAAIERLQGMNTDEIIRNADIRGNEQELLIDSMNKEYRLLLPQFQFSDELEMWHHLTLLQYLFTADGEPLSGKWISLADMPGGLSRGYGFNKDISLMFERNFNGIDGSTFSDLCRKIGGVAAENSADAAMIINYAPRFPVLINFWESDDEFSCSGKVFVDANAHHYLTIEAAGGACSAVVQRLIDLKNE